MAASSAPASSFVIRSSSGRSRSAPFHQRDVILSALSDLPPALVATDAEVLSFIERHALSGCGIGYVDVNLLAPARLSGARLWAQDKALHETAGRLDLAAAAGGEPGRDLG